MARIRREEMDKEGGGSSRPLLCILSLVCFDPRRSASAGRVAQLRGPFFLRGDPMANSFGSLSQLTVGPTAYQFHKLAPVYKAFHQADRLPFSLQSLLE